MNICSGFGGKRDRFRYQIVVFGGKRDRFRYKHNYFCYKIAILVTNTIIFVTKLRFW
ncbi:hypothetical protein H6G93_04885 [Nostoc sp. FACHB-973]|nr:hypothetical protein [Nostoc sp. FACHB-973]